MWKCPECLEEITSLKYNQSVTEYRTEYGTYALPESGDAFEGDHDCDDSETNDSDSGDDTIYSCPHCEAEISLSSLENTEEESNPHNEPRNNDRTKITFLTESSRKNLICDTDIESHKIPKYIKCPFCRHLILAGGKCSNDNDWDYEDAPSGDTCPNCFKPLLQLKS